MTMINTIYLDMDGVLVDFVRGACELYNYDPLMINKTVQEHVNASDEDFWNLIDSEGEAFWTELPMYRYAKTLVNRCQHKSKVIVLTDPSFGAFCYGGKKLWMMKHFPDIPVYMAAEKWRLARRGDVLIDDKPSNVRDFNNHGGHGIMFPQRWNGYHVDAKDKVKYIEYQLSHYILMGNVGYV